MISHPDAKSFFRAWRSAQRLDVIQPEISADQMKHIEHLPIIFPINLMTELTAILC